jgi:signal transduction histidine kinase
MNLADVCIVDLVADNGDQKRFAVAHRDPECERHLSRIRSEWPLDPESNYGPSYVLKTGKSLFYPTIDDDMKSRWIGPSPGGPDLSEFGLRSAIIVPIAARGEMVGVLTVASTTPGRYGDAELGLIEELGRRAALAIDNALLYTAAREAVASRDQFLSVAAHELRTPITAISGFTALLERELANRNDAERVRRFTNRLRDAGIRLSALVDDLLDVSHIRIGSIPLRIESVDVQTLLERLYQRYMEQDTFPNHLLVLRKPSGNCVIPADEDRLEQVVSNVIDNAIKYTPSGGEIVVELQGDQDGVLLSVMDHGIGLAADDLDSIFKPFGRAENAVAGNFLGLGIGLYICRNIIERHGGRIWAESAGVGTGTTIRIWLPSNTS